MKTFAIIVSTLVLAAVSALAGPPDPPDTGMPFPPRAGVAVEKTKVALTPGITLLSSQR